MIAGRFLKAVLFAGALVVAGGWTTVTPAQAPPEDPGNQRIERLIYRGSDAILASGGGILLTEADLFLFQAVAGRPTDVARDWESARAANDRARLARLKSEVRHCIRTILLSREEDPILALDQSLDLKGVRLLAAAVATILWKESVVQERIAVDPLDVVFYYRKHREEFVIAPQARIRRLRIPLSLSGGDPEREAALAEGRRLIAEARELGTLEPLMARETAYIVDPSPAPIEVTRESRWLDATLLDVAMSSDIGIYAEPVALDTAVYVIEVVSRRDGSVVPLEEARPGIERKLRASFLPQQYDYTLSRTARAARATNRAAIFALLPQDADLLRVRDFSLTKREFTALFPQVVGNPERPRRAAIQAAVQRFVEGEIITQDLELRGTITGPEYAQALDFAKVILRAGRIEQRRRLAASPTEAEIDAFVAENRAVLQPEPKRQLWQYAIAPRRRGLVPPESLSALRVVNAATLRELTTVARQQFRERVQIAGQSVLTRPQPVIQNLPKPDDDRFVVRFQRLDPLTPAEVQDQFGVDVRGLEPGDFTPVDSTEDGSVRSFFLSQILSGETLTEAEVRSRARALLIDRAGDVDIFRRIDELEQAGALVYHFEPKVTP